MRYFVFETQRRAEDCQLAIFAFGKDLATRAGYATNAEGIIPKRKGRSANGQLVRRWDTPRQRLDGKWVVAHPEKHASFSDPIAAQMLMNSLPDAVVEVEDADIWWPAPD